MSCFYTKDIPEVWIKDYVDRYIAKAEALRGVNDELRDECLYKAVYAYQMLAEYMKEQS